MKILFVGNDASRTGAPIGLLCFLRWLKENTDVEFEIMLRIGRGPLLEDYEALAPAVCYDRIDHNPTLAQRAARRLGLRSIGGRSCLSAIEQHFENSGVDLILANTVTQGAVLADLARLRIPAICYVHELEWGIKRCGSRNMAQVKKHAQRFIACSRAVKHNLVEQHGIRAEKIEVVYEMLPPRPLPTPEAVASAKKLLKLTESDFVVGGCGSHAWRKGRDLFVDLARENQSRNPDGKLHFVWVGGPPQEGVADENLPSEGETGLESILHFVPEVENPLDYFAAFDVFAMVSREDPFPIANLECASLGKPVICFEGSGGSREFVEEDAGFVAPYLDVRGMADKIILLREDSELRARLGKHAAEKAGKHAVSEIAPQLLDCIRRNRP